VKVSVPAPWHLSVMPAGNVGRPGRGTTVTSVHAGPAVPQAFSTVTQTCAVPVNAGSQVTVAVELVSEMLLPAPVMVHEKLVAPVEEVEKSVVPDPWQTEVDPEGEVGLPGSGLIVTFRVEAELTPQLLEASTETIPEFGPKVTEIEVEPCPEFIIAAVGTVQL